MMGKTLILVVDDDKGMRDILRDLLQDDGYEVHDAGDGVEALSFISGYNDNPSPDVVLSLVILDIVMPGMDGYEVCRRIREISAVPIMALSGLRLSPQEKARCIDLGADDYMTKPFAPQEMRSRVKALLRREGKAGLPANVIISGDGYLTITLDARRLTAGSKLITLTPREYGILLILVNNAGKVVTSDQLLKRVWGQEYISDTNLLHTCIARLRTKIEPDTQHPRYLITVERVGYRLQLS
jgi:DNA-binding response OmpR family regulator